MGVLAVVGVLAGCGPAATPAPTPTGPGVLSPAAASPPVEGGEVGTASTEFDDASQLAVWSRLSETEQDLDRLAKVDANTTVKGSLYLEPKPSTWFNGFRGPFLYQELAGPIVMHMRVKVDGKRSALPRRKFSLGGAMLRVPGSDAKPNWLSITVGTADRSGQVEVKDTRDGSSKPDEFTVKDGWVELVLARTDRLVAALYKEEGGTWKVGKRWARGELPYVLQWGVTAYTDWDSFALLKKDQAKANAQQIKGLPDLKLSVDYVRFLRPTLPKNVDPLNTASVSDEALIKALTPAGA